MNEFTIEREQIDGGVVVRLRGDLDLAVSPLLRDAMQEVFEEKPGRVIVNMQGVTMLDSSGIAVLIESLRFCRRRRMSLALCSPSEPVRRVLELARLDEGVFEIIDGTG